MCSCHVCTCTSGNDPPGCITVPRVVPRPPRMNWQLLPPAKWRWRCRFGAGIPLRRVSSRASETTQARTTPRRPPQLGPPVLPEDLQTLQPAGPKRTRLLGSERAKTMPRRARESQFIAAVPSTGSNLQNDRRTTPACGRSAMVFARPCCFMVIIRGLGTRSATTLAAETTDERPLTFFMRSDTLT